MKKLLVMMTAVATLASCSKDEDPIIVVPPSSGSTMELLGLRGAETGPNAAHSVFVDFSTAKQSSLARDSWDLGFYTGSDFRLIINNTATAYAKATGKTDMNTVGSADTAGIKMSFDQMRPSAADFALMDNINGLASQSLISASATEADNKVYILNRGLGGGITREAGTQFFKIRVLRSGNGYTLQYAPLTATTFNTIQVSKAGEGNFVYLSLTNGAIVNGLPAKKDWDIQWGYGVYKTNFGGTEVMYQFSDLVVLNVVENVQAFQRIYGSADLAADAYTKFNKDSVAKYAFAADRWVIGDKWRTASQSTTSVAKDRFYIVKDPAGNIYKLKFLSFATQDGGTRGKPQISYELIK